MCVGCVVTWGVFGDLICHTRVVLVGETFWTLGFYFGTHFCVNDFVCFVCCTNIFVVTLGCSNGSFELSIALL